MSVLESLHLLQDLPRLREVAVVLVRHGLGELLRRAGVSAVLERAGEALVASPDETLRTRPLPERARLALEALGPTYVKLGQVLSTRVDMLGPEWIDAFEQLQYSVAPAPREAVLAEMALALGRPPDVVFREFDPEPFAAASIAQVYRARLADGSPVVVKVRRPGIGPVIESDLRILGTLARLVERELPELRRFQPVEMVAQFGRSLRRELDLALEARNQQRFAANFAGDDTVVIPRVHREYGSAALNVQERVEGVPGNDLALVERAGLDRRVLAARGAAAVLKMILVDGFFHADPHPGNVLYLRGNRICLVDFGMVGRLSDRRRDQIVDLLAAVSRRDEQGMMRVLLDWTGEADVDESRLAQDLGELVSNYEHLALEDIHVGQLLSDVAAIMRDHAIVMPADLTLLFKALITLEGLGRRLDPSFRLVDELRPFVRRVVMDRYDPRTLSKRLRHRLGDALAAAGALPGDLARLLREARQGRLRVEFELHRLDHFGHQLERSANRITLGLVTAALIVGSSIVMTVRGGPELLGLPLLGVAGFLMASLNAVWLVVSIWRSNRE